RDRLLIFGGTTASQGDEYWSNEVWALSLSGSPSLTQITASGTPPTARSDASMIYDSARDRLVVFGGIGPPGGAAKHVGRRRRPRRVPVPWRSTASHGARWWASGASCSPAAPPTTSGS